MPVTLTCAQCGTTFQKPPSYLKYSTARYCSKACHDQAQSHKVTLRCAACDTSFQVPPSQVKRQYCSQTCAAKVNGARSQQRVTRTCKGCDTVMSIPQSQVKYAPYHYCSLACKRAHTYKVSNCATCGKLFEHKRSRLAARYCSDECRHGGWRGSAFRQTSKPCAWCGVTITDVISHINRRRFCSHGCRMAWVSEVAGRAGSRAEAAFADALVQAGVNLKRHHPIGRYSVDIYIPDARLIVEFDGVYWHTLPGVPERDVLRERYLIEQGYRVVRVLDTEYRAHPDASIQRVLDALA